MKRKNKKLNAMECAGRRLTSIPGVVCEYLTGWIPSSRNYRNADYPVFHFLRGVCVKTAYIWITFILPALKMIGFIFLGLCVNFLGEIGILWLARNI